jgi:tetratricopeptide (TPR) repeat protein
LAALLALAAATGTGAAEPPPSPPALVEELQVTAVELAVAVDRGAVGAWLHGDDAGPRLDATELELRVGGERLEVTAVERPANDGEPRRVVVFLDTMLGDQASVRWAATLLAERAGDLVAAGEVEVVVADPDPRVMVAATRDAELLRAALSDLSLFAGDDAAIPLLRDQFLEELESLHLDAGGDGSDLHEAELARAYLEAETTLVLERQDLLLRRLIDDRARVAGHSGGALIYVAQGFDPAPEAFYLGSSASSGGDRRLERETVSWAGSVAAYGWTALPLVFEDRRALLRRGLRIGKWRFRGPSGKIGGPLVLLRGSYEGARDPDKAEALVELGDTLVDAGDVEQASDAYLRAIHHFYGDPRTKSRQAYAWRQLAVALRRAGDVDPARRALANAIELDPSLADEERGGASPAIVVEGLDQLAAETGGHLLRARDDLRAALGELSRRQRLSFTLRGTPSGELLPIELSGGDGAPALRHARWTRSGTPERVAVARLRLAVASVAEEPATGGAAPLDLVAAEHGPSVATVALSGLVGARPMRVLLGTVGEETAARVTVLARSTTAGGSGPAPWRGEVYGDDFLAAAVYREDLVSGEWSVEPLEIAVE